VNRRPIIAGVVAGVVLLAALFLFVLPKMRQVGDVNDQVGAAQDDASGYQAQLDALKQAQAQAPETQAKIATIEAQIPPEPGLPELFLQLQAAADRSAVDFFSFTPTPRTSRSPRPSSSTRRTRAPDRARRPPGRAARAGRRGQPGRRD
jgi:Tfp pilus assembly protein PilO